MFQTTNQHIISIHGKEMGNITEYDHGKHLSRPISLCMIRWEYTYYFRLVIFSI
jgi:glycine cleavage system aminomethyltransferase T